MIRILDATTLALTKLRTRKVRLVITIVISGLLFSGLVAASLIAHGVISGIAGFSREGLGNRYIAQASTQGSFGGLNSPQVIDRALAIQKDIVARKKAEAKRLDITYDPATDQSPVIEYDTPNGKQRSLNPTHPAAKQALQEQLATKPATNIDTLQQIAKSYSASNYYTSKQLPFDMSGAQLQVLKDGKESFDATVGGKYGPPSGTETFVTAWTLMSGDLLKPFILPGQNLQTGTDGSIPVIVPNSAAEQLLKLKALPASASVHDRLERTKEIRTKAVSLRFAVCYRNATSSSLVSQAISTQKELEQNKDKKDYQKPDLIYGLPTEACGTVPVTRDVRSYDEKVLDDKQRQFNETFGTPAAEQSTMSFRIVGIVPDADYGSAFGVGQIIRSLVNSSLGNGWYSPIEQTNEKPLLASLFNHQATIFGAPEIFYAEFNTATDARAFIEKENCDIDYSKVTPENDPDAICLAKHHPFIVGPFGSNSLALESAKRGFGKFFTIAAAVVSVIACIIMMGTVGRMIADSRRETAVFRAIGAKKLDIAQIYVIYTIFLSLLISLFAILAGLVVAAYLNHRWSPELTIQAIIAYNAQDLSRTFSLYAFYVPDLLLLVGLTLAAGLLSAVLPLFRNLRRNPIRDMRDDT